MRGFNRVWPRKIWHDLAALAMLCAAPAAAQPTASPPPIIAPIVGADNDAHGCIGSAGYTWSAVRKSCLRLFEAGIRLNPRRKPTGVMLSAFVVFASDDDDRLAEVFLPGRPAALLLHHVRGSGAGKWRGAGYVLSQWKGMYMLDTARGRPLYAGSTGQ